MVIVVLERSTSRQCKRDSGTVFLRRHRNAPSGSDHLLLWWAESVGLPGPGLWGLVLPGQPGLQQHPLQAHTLPRAGVRSMKSCFPHLELVTLTYSFAGSCKLSKLWEYMHILYGHHMQQMLNMPHKR